MKDYDDEFLSTFNECYPFERYIFSTPQQLGMLFDDVQMTEIFVPYTEIKSITNEDGSLICFTGINTDEIYIKVIGKSFLHIGCKDGEVVIYEVQVPGKKDKITISEFLNGYKSRLNYTQYSG